MSCIRFIIDLTLPTVSADDIIESDFLGIFDRQTDERGVYSTAEIAQEVIDLLDQEGVLERIDVWSEIWDD